MIYLLVAQRQAFTMEYFLATWGAALAPRIRVVHYERLFAGRSRVMPPGTYVFSSLGSDMGSRNPPGRKRELAAELHQHLVERFGPGRVLNDPAATLSRYDLLTTLFERGLNGFTAYRAGEPVAPRRYPVFLRRERGSAWETPPLLGTPREYEAALAQCAERDQLLAVEYCDTADDDGIYRKYSCFVLGDRIVPRHLFFNRGWMVKEAALCEPAQIEEEMAFLDSNPHAAALLEAARIARIGYGRVDYALLDGQPQIWEINVTPQLFGRPEHELAARRPAQLRFVEHFAAALDTIDPSP